MFSNDERVIYAKRQLVEVICQLRFPEILKIDVSEPADFQERIRRDYPQYEKKIEQLPPQMVNGKPVPQGTVNNYQFVSAEGQWRVSLTKGFIALSTYGYTRWEDFAQRLDRVLAAFIETYHPSWFTRVGPAVSPWRKSAKPKPWPRRGWTISSLRMRSSARRSSAASRRWRSGA